MSIHWLDLAKVALVSLLFGVGVVAVFTLGLLGLSRAEAGSEAGGSGVAAGRAVAGTCFAVCAVTVLYGIYLIVPQFH